MREAIRRPGAAGDAEGPQSADDADAAGGGGEAQRAARAQRAQKRRDAAADADADAFNQRHETEVAEFNQLTKDACIGEDGKLDAAAVKDWQRAHNVAPDGKIGPKTVAAAGGKSAEASGAEGADAQLAPHAASGSGKAKGPLEEIVSWLDLPTIQQVLEELAMLAKVPKDEGKDADAEAKPIDANGLASTLSVDRFASAAKQLQDKTWKSSSPHDRAHAIVLAANEELRAAGAIDLDFEFDKSLSPDAPGQFFHEEWRMHLLKTPFVGKKLDDKTATTIVDTVYHEARHAEQNFRVAQLLAGQGKSPAEVFKLTKIDKRAIAAAHAHPITPDGPGAAQAQALFDDKYGSGKPHHRAAEDDARAKIEEYQRVKLLTVKASTPEEKEAAQKQLEALKPVVMAAWQTYASLTTEVDARAVGHLAKSDMAKREAKQP